MLHSMISFNENSFLILNWNQRNAGSSSELTLYNAVSVFSVCGAAILWGHEGVCVPTHRDGQEQTICRKNGCYRCSNWQHGPHISQVTCVFMTFYRNLLLLEVVKLHVACTWDTVSGHCCTCLLLWSRCRISASHSAVQGPSSAG